MGTPVLLRDVGAVRIGPAQRRGLADLDGEGEVVGGVVVARSGTNALQVIDAVKARIQELQSTLPRGVQIVPTYDRSTLIRASIDTLEHTLIEELIVVTLVILLFLLHLRSTLVPALLLPIAVVLAFIPMKHMGLTANIMSLGGIAIAIGAMVDAAIIGALVLIVVTIPVVKLLGSEFMPPLNEGTLLYMPTSVPGMSDATASDVLQRQDQVLRRFPEVERVFGKAGRFDSPTDPAPLSMFETVVTLKDPSLWPNGEDWDALVSKLDGAMQFAGMPNVWWMPIQTRTEMLATGVRSPLGVLVLGPDTKEIDRIGAEIEAALRDVPGTRSAFSERIGGGYFLDFDVDRDRAARFGLNVGDVEDVVETAVGGLTVSTTVEGRERYPVTVRYARDFRSDLNALGRVRVATMSGAQISLGQVANLKLRSGPSMLRDENGQLAGYVFADTARPIDDYVRDAKKAVMEKVKLPPGYRLDWAGQYRYLERAKARLATVIPLTLAIIFMLLFFNSGSAVEALLVMLAVPFSLVGAFWLLWLLGYNMSVAVWVGLIALAGLDAETGIVMLLYLDLAWKEGKPRTREEAREAVVAGAVKRIRPKMMTVATILAGLLPVLWSTGTGADVMKRIAAPMVGGVVTSALLELVVYPALYLIWKGRRLPTGASPAPITEGVTT